MFSIEPARPGDEGALLPLLLAQYEEHAISVPSERLAQAVVAALEGEERGKFLVARHASEGIVGLAYVSFAWPLEVADKTMWLEELYVTPTHRGNKLGERLLLGVLSLAEESGCRTMDLEVERSHERVTAFYTRHGFRPHRRTHWTLRLRDD